MRILPADKLHPPRPDWPVVRHLTFTEIHAIELGLYFGMVLIWTLLLNVQILGLLLVVMVGRKIISRKRCRGNGTEAGHEIGFHDVVIEPPYFGFGAVVVLVAYHGSVAVMAL